MNKRIKKFRRLLSQAGVEAGLVTNFTNVTYLTGFTGDDSYLLVTAESEVLLSDMRYEEQLESECPELQLEIRRPGVKMLDALTETISSMGVSKLGIEAESITVGLHNAIAEALQGIELKPTSGLVERLRMIKDKEEIDKLRKAVKLAEKTFQMIKIGLRPEQTEREIAHQIEHQIRLFGGQGCSFAPIVAAGPRAALPHATPSDQKICESDFVLIDWGARSEHYRSDLTRVLVTGKLSPKLERIYGLVLQAQLAAIDAIRPGAVLSDVDAAARNVISAGGFGKQFGHGLGHGIGLDIHEAPRLAMDQPDQLAAGMVVTVEPGIYLPGWGGVRIEDDVLVTRDGHEVLTRIGKELPDCMVD